jgi:DNA-binding Lrp family transcriptional regulator
MMNRRRLRYVGAHVGGVVGVEAHLACERDSRVGGRRVDRRAGTAPLTRDLDDVDRSIIRELTADARVRTRALTARVGLTEATISARIKSLQDRRILGVSAIFDWTAAGYSVDLRLSITVEGRPVTAVAEDLSAIRYVRWVMLVLGEYDIVLHVQLPDRDASLESLLSAVNRVDGVRRLTAEINLEMLKYQVQFARVPIAPSEPDFPSPTVDLDALDRAIVESLVAEGRQSNRAIARHIGTSDGTVRMRVRRLEEAGLLRVCALTDPYRTGQVNAWAYLGLDVDLARLRGVATQLMAMPEVLILTVSSGQHPLVALVAAEQRSALTDIVMQRVRALNGVRRTDTSEIVRTVKLDYRWARFLAPSLVPS